MRRLTALKTSHFDRDHHSVVASLLLYKIVQKKKGREKKQHQQFVSSVWRRVKTTWATLTCLKSACSGGCFIKFAVKDRWSGEWFSAALSKTFQIFFIRSNSFFLYIYSDVPILATGTPTSQMICKKWRITSSLHPCNSQTIIIGTHVIFTSRDEHTKQLMHFTTVI